MTTIRIEYPNQNVAGMFRAIAFDETGAVLELAEANRFTAAADLIHEIFPDARFDDDALEQVMVESQLQVH